MTRTALIAAAQTALDNAAAQTTAARDATRAAKALGVAFARCMSLSQCGSDDTVTVSGIVADLMGQSDDEVATALAEYPQGAASIMAEVKALEARTEKARARLAILTA